MLIRIVAVGTRMPAWVDQAVGDYGGRFPPDFTIEWKEIKAEPRGASGSPAAWMAREAARIRQALPAGATVVALDEHGRDLDTRALADRLARWRDAARPLAIVIGGPDGLDAGFKAQADERIRLSSMTLAHPLVRVVLAEQLFRAWSILANHPYHRA
ncbi:MAG: 23S rRNA (pseudouridine(1915)-N(3))-methyltransferase RlmH [Burkholderiaceae bacterium]